MAFPPLPLAYRGVLCAHLSMYSCLSPPAAGKRQQTAVLHTQTVLTGLTETVSCLQFSKILQMQFVFLQNWSVTSKSSLLPPALKERELYGHVGEVEFECELCVCGVCRQNKRSNSDGTFVY